MYIDNERLTVCMAEERSRAKRTLGRIGGRLSREVKEAGKS